MRRWLVLGTIVLMLVAVVTFAAINLDSYLNRNQAWLAAHVEQALGRRVSFEEVGVSIFGGLGVRIVNLRVADDPRFSRKDFVRADRVQVVVRILPALFGRYEVDHLTVENPVVVVIRTADGFNIDTIGGESGAFGQARPVATGEQPEPDTPDPARSRGSQPAALFISAMRVSDGEIHFVDRRAVPSREGAGEISIRDLDFSASHVSLTERIHLEVSAALLAGEEQNFEFKGTIGPIGDTLDPSQVPFLARIEIDSLDVDALGQVLPELTAQIPPGLGLSGPLSLSVQLAGSPAEVWLSDLELAAAVFAADEPNLIVRGALGPVVRGGLDPGLPIDLRVELDPVAIDEIRKLDVLTSSFPPELSAPDPVRVRGAAKGTLDGVRFNASFDGSDAAIGFGSTFVKPRGVPLRLDVQGTRSGETIEVADLKIRLARLSLSGRGTVVVADPIGFDVQIDVGRTRLDGWERLVPELADYDVSGTVAARLHAAGELAHGGIPQVTGAVDLRDVRVPLERIPTVLEGFSSTVELGDDAVVLPPTRFSVGGSPVELQATVDRFQARVVSFGLRSEELRPASIGIAGAPGDTDEVIRDLTIDGTLSVAQETPSFGGVVRSSSGRIRDMDYQDLEAEVRLAQRVATLDGVRVRAVGGTATGSGHYDMRDVESPKFDLTSRIEGMQVHGLLAGGFPDAATKIVGHLHADLSLAGAGKGWETIRRTLRGGGHAELRDGALKNVNIAEGALGEVTGVAGLSDLIPRRVRDKYPELFHGEDTKFDTLGGSARIAEGRVVTDDLIMVAKDYTIRGRGAFTFESQVDFTATITASQQLTDDVLRDVRVAKHLTGSQGRLEIPFHLTGALPRVRPRPNMDFVGRAARGALLEDSVDKLLGVMGKGEKKQKRHKQKGKKNGRKKRWKKGPEEQLAPTGPVSPAPDPLEKVPDGTLGR